MPGQNSVIVDISTFKFKFVNLYVLKYIHIYYQNVTDSLKTVESVASPQTSVGVRLSRIHFSPTDRGGEMNA